MARAYEHLQKLSAHLKGLDSGSQDASAIDCILGEVDRLRENFTLKESAGQLLDACKFAFAAMDSEEGRTRAKATLIAAIARATS